MMRQRIKHLPVYQIDPDEILLDDSNLPSFNTQQFEGRIERPISKATFYLLGIIFFLVCLIFVGKVGQLQIINGSVLAKRSVNNSLRQIPIFAQRGLITDRNDVELVWNTPDRSYIDKTGFGHLLGYISYPTEKEMASDKLFPNELVGRDGAEKVFGQQLQGENGIKIEEVNAAGQIESDSVLRPPKTGANLVLAIDSRIQAEMAKAIENLVDQGTFQAGAGVMMDIKTGELLVLTSFPEYDPEVLSRGNDRTKINSYLSDGRQFFLNRAIDGLYTPGSIIKPIIALGALTEGVIAPETKILSTGSISIPNPYDPKQSSVFKDWRANGWVNIREALAVSSDVYFYEVGGGYQNQRGLGIAKIDQYARMFGLGQPTGIDFLTEEIGVIPTPEWKAKVFNGEPWRLGDTYHTAIGQYGFQVTPMQMVRAVAGVASSGHLVTPTVLKAKPDDPPPVETIITGVNTKNYTIVREGMRMGVTAGLSRSLDFSELKIAVKTGTAELGTLKKYVNSWITGFFPYDSPRYAFAIVMEKGSRDNLIGASVVMRQTLDWIIANAPEYLTGK